MKVYLHPPGVSFRIVIRPSVSTISSLIWIKSLWTPMDFSRNNVAVVSVWVPVWVIFWANNARLVTSNNFALSNAFLFTFGGGALITVRHGGRSSFCISFEGFRAGLGCLNKFKEKKRYWFKIIDGYKNFKFIFSNCNNVLSNDSHKIACINVTPSLVTTITMKKQPSTINT